MELIHQVFETVPNKMGHANTVIVFDKIWTFSQHFWNTAYNHTEQC